MPTAPRTPPDPDACAREMLEVLPFAVRWMRATIRRQAPAWSLPQVQALGYLRFNPGASLSDLAGHLGVGLPTASTLVSRLVTVGQVDRRDDPTERRRTLLRLTARGERQLEAALAASAAELAERLATLPARDLTRLCQALTVIQDLFADA